MPNYDPGLDYVSPDPNAPTSRWNSDPVYNLGNAWISFGNTLYQTAAGLDATVNGLTTPSGEGGAGWDGWAAEGANAAIGPLTDQARTFANACWDTGEAINYYAMLRDQQEHTVAHQRTADLLMEILAPIMAIPLMFTGGVLGAITDAISFIVANVAAVRVIVEAAVSGLSSIAARVGTWAGPAVTSVAENAPWALTLGQAVVGIGDVGVNFAADWAAINTFTVLTADALSGARLDPNSLNPFPVNPGNFAEFAGFLVGGVALKGAADMAHGGKPEGADPVVVPSVGVAGNVPEVPVPGVTGKGGDNTFNNGAGNAPEIGITAPGTPILGNSKVIEGAAGFSPGTVHPGEANLSSEPVTPSSGVDGLVGSPSRVTPGPGAGAAIPEPKPATPLTDQGALANGLVGSPPRVTPGPHPAALEPKSATPLTDQGALANGLVAPPSRVTPGPGAGAAIPEPKPATPPPTKFSSAAAPHDTSAPPGATAGNLPPTAKEAMPAQDPSHATPTTPPPTKFSSAVTSHDTSAAPGATAGNLPPTAKFAAPATEPGAANASRAVTGEHGGPPPAHLDAPAGAPKSPGQDLPGAGVHDITATGGARLQGSDVPSHASGHVSEASGNGTAGAGNAHVTQVPPSSDSVAAGSAAGGSRITVDGGGGKSPVVGDSMTADVPASTSMHPNGANGHTAGVVRTGSPTDKANTRSSAGGTNLDATPVDGGAKPAHPTVSGSDGAPHDVTARQGASSPGNTGDHGSATPPGKSAAPAADRSGMGATAVKPVPEDGLTSGVAPAAKAADQVANGAVRAEPVAAKPAAAKPTADQPGNSGHEPAAARTPEQRIPEFARYVEEMGMPGDKAAAWAENYAAAMARGDKTALQALAKDLPRPGAAHEPLPPKQQGQRFAKGNAANGADRAEPAAAKPAAAKPVADQPGNSGHEPSAGRTPEQRVQALAKYAEDRGVPEGKAAAWAAKYDAAWARGDQPAIKALAGDLPRPGAAHEPLPPKQQGQRFAKGNAANGAAKQAQSKDSAAASKPAARSPSIPEQGAKGDHIGSSADGTAPQGGSRGSGTGRDNTFDGKSPDGAERDSRMPGRKTTTPVMEAEKSPAKSPQQARVERKAKEMMEQALADHFETEDTAVKPAAAPERSPAAEAAAAQDAQETAARAAAEAAVTAARRAGAQDAKRAAARAAAAADRYQHTLGAVERRGSPLGVAGRRCPPGR